MSVEISNLLGSDKSHEIFKGMEAAQKAKSYFHLLQILKLTTHHDREVVSQAVAVLIDLSVSCLSPSQNPPPDAVTSAAVKIIKKLNPGYISKLNNKINRGTDDEIIKAMMILKHFVNKNKARNLLVRFLKHPNRKLRATAVLYMGGAASRITADAFADYLKDGDNRVKANAVEVLEELNDPSFISILNQFRKDENNRVRGNALKALFNVGVDKIKDDLKFMLMDPQELMKASAVWVLGEIGSQEAGFLDLLEIVKKESTPLVKNNLLILLKKLGDLPELEYLRVSLKEDIEEKMRDSNPEMSDLNFKDVSNGTPFKQLSLKGSITSITLPDLSQSLKSFSEVNNKIILDFSSIDYIDNSAIKALVELNKSLKNEDGYLYIYNCSYNVAELFELSKMGSKLNIFQNKEEINTFLGL